MDIITFSNTTAVISLLLALFSIIYTVRSNTKKYELSVSYRNDVLAWYSQVIDVLSSFIHIANIIEHNDIKKIELQASLSALIEKGRFFYPNINKNDEHGNYKFNAFKGHKNITLEFLTYFYYTMSQNNIEKYEKHLIYLYKGFTSSVFDNLDPVNHNKKILQYTSSTTIPDITLEEFLESKIGNIGIFCECKEGEAVNTPHRRIFR